MAVDHKEEYPYHSATELLFGIDPLAEMGVYEEIAELENKRGEPESEVDE